MSAKNVDEIDTYAFVVGPEKFFSANDGTIVLSDNMCLPHSNEMDLNESQKCDSIQHFKNRLKCYYN